MVSGNHNVVALASRNHNVVERHDVTAPTKRSLFVFHGSVKK